MILTGDPIGAARAAELGTVNTVVPHERLLEAASELAGRIIRHAATAVTACLAAVTRGINLPIDEGLGVEASWFAVTVPTQGVRDGLQAFLNRSRGPVVTADPGDRPLQAAQRPLVALSIPPTGPSGHTPRRNLSR
jgi:enoyl-CoA hydratase